MVIMKCDRCGGLAYYKKEYAVYEEDVEIDLCKKCERDLRKFLDGEAVPALKRP